MMLLILASGHLHFGITTNFHLAGVPGNNSATPPFSTPRSEPDPIYRDVRPAEKQDRRGPSWRGGREERDGESQGCGLGACD
jgi:hypothetical protein